VGNSIPIGVGLALSLKQKKEKSLSCIFFGEAATEEGVFYESLNFAAAKKLPALFVCENNGYSVYSNLAARQNPKKNILEISRSLGVRSIKLTASEPNECLSILPTLISRIKMDSEPVLIEFETYRFLEHCGPNDDDHLNYRPKGELLRMIVSDPLKKLEANLISENLLSLNEFRKLQQKIDIEISEAFTFADASPFLNLNKMKEYVYQK
jgi:pyruvate dehydrogenase E1 component alpha subunit